MLPQTIIRWLQHDTPPEHNLSFAHPVWVTLELSYRSGCVSYKYGYKYNAGVYSFNTNRSWCGSTVHRITVQVRDIRPKPERLRNRCG